MHKIDDDTMEIEKTSNSLVIKCRGGNIKLPLCNHNIKPIKFTDGEWKSIDIKMLLRLLNSVEWSSNRKMSKQLQTIGAVAIKTEGGVTTTMAIDGISFAKAFNDCGTDDHEILVLSTMAIQKLALLAENVQISIDKSWVHLKDDKYLLSIRQLENIFPMNTVREAEQTTIDNADAWININRDGFLAAVNLCMAAKVWHVDIVTEKNGIKLIGYSQSGNAIDLEVEAEKKGADFNVRLDVKKLLSTIKSFSDDKINISVVSSIEMVLENGNIVYAPVVFSVPGYIAGVMPTIGGHNHE